MAHLTRHELKVDKFQTTIGQIAEALKQRGKEITAALVLALVVLGGSVALRLYLNRREAEANTKLAAALQTFRAYVGVPAPDMLGQGTATFSTAQEKYKKALEQFSALTETHGIEKFLPRPKAVQIARYHLGLCQAHLGDHNAAQKTLEETVRSSDPNIRSLAQFALAEEQLATGKTEEAAKLYQQLADRPTDAVPRAAALLAQANAYRATQPQRARQIYEQLQKEFSADASLSAAMKAQIANLAQ